MAVLTARTCIYILLENKLKQQIAYFFAFLTVQYSLALSAEARSVDIEDLLKRERLGTVIHDQSRDSLLYERVRPLGDMATSLPYWIMHEEAKKEILRVDLSKPERPMLLFEHERGRGYSFATPDAISPDGLYAAVVETYNGSRRLGVVELEGSAISFLDVDFGLSSPYAAKWTTDSKLVLIAREPGAEETTFSAVVQGARNRSLAQERSWGGLEPSSGVVGAGRFSHEPISPTTMKLLEFDPKAKSLRNLAHGVFLKFELSHDDRFVAVWEREFTGNRADDSRGLFAQGAWRQHVLVVNRLTGDAHRIEARAGEDLETLGWAHTRALLTVLSKRRTPGGADGQREHAVYDASSMSIRRTYYVFDPVQNTTWLELPEDLDTRYWASGPYWFGRSMFVALDADADADADGVWGVYDANRVFHEVFGGASYENVRPVALSEGSIFVLADGHLWAVSPEGKQTRIAFDFPLEYVATLSQLVGNQNQVTASVSDTEWGLLPDLSEILFKSRSDESEYVLQYNPTTEAVEVCFPYTDLEHILKALGGCSAVILANDFESGSRILYRTRSANTELAQFNQHLIGVQVTETALPLRTVGLADAEYADWLHLPPGANPDDSLQYPLVVVPYGGMTFPSDLRFHRQSYDAFDLWSVSPVAPTTLELLTARGYAVLRPSLPLSPVGKAADPMLEISSMVASALETALETGLIDPERLAVVGHSFGGYSVLSTIVGTDAFDAAIASAPISNFTDQYGEFFEYKRVGAASQSMNRLTNAWMFEYGQMRMAGAPWDNPKRYIRNSPVFSADKIDTPLMLIHGDLDFVGIGQSEQIYTALSRQEKDVLFIRYWGEEHRVSQPANQLDMWSRVFRFLEDNGVTPGPKVIQ